MQEAKKWPPVKQGSEAETSIKCGLSDARKGSCFAHQTPQLRSPDQCPTQLTLLRVIKKRPSPQDSAWQGQGVNEANLRSPRNAAKGTGETRAEPPRAMQEQRQLCLLARPRI
ncbi:hypothetical protein PR202_ga12898 [Eleusine coracana subsp. coracana]|uniref:Uncharacterized protein n=1 Tax=Eleusine coracana subsp. coracana TaxID=191504 RepID=A0AAV5CCV3_ELECO|nr:hypothetical protein PR202_ga12898 [Eleusine coracana subsp. coracana]